MIEAEWWDYESEQEWAEAVAGDIGFIIESAVDARDASLIALPGDKSLTPVFALLAKQKLPWKKVTIIPTDDRVVAVDNELSNVRELARTFLPIGARVLPVVSAATDDYQMAGNAADARLRDLPWPPDLVLLSMDESGGTAGLLAGPDLDSALDAPKARRAVGLKPEPMPTDAPVARVTLTRASILSARTIVVALRGEDKRDLLEGAIADGQSSKLPIGRVFAEADQPVDIHWLA